MTRTHRNLAALGIAFVLTGMDCTMLGPALPTLASAWGLADVRSGTLLFVQPVVGVLGALLCTRNLFVSIVGGACSLTLGLLLFGTGNYGVAHLALGATGFGFGLLLTAGNILCGQLAGEDDRRRARLLAWLNFAWGVGAISSAPIFDAFRTHGRPFWFFWTLSAAIALSAAFSYWALRDAARNGGAGIRADRDHVNKHSLLSVRVRLLFALAVFLYSGMEDAISGWLPTYTQRLLTFAQHSGAASLGAYCATAFFCAEMLGRLALPAALIKLRQTTLYLAALLLLLVALAGVLALPSAAHLSSPTIIFPIAVLAGLGVAPLYPLLLAALIGRARTEHGLGWVFACGGIGGGTLPLLAGALSSENHGALSVRWAFLVPAVAAIALLMLRKLLRHDKEVPATLCAVPPPAR